MSDNQNTTGSSADAAGTGTSGSRRYRYAAGALAIMAIGLFAGWWLAPPAPDWYQRGLEALAHEDLKTLHAAARALRRATPEAGRTHLLLGALALRSNDPQQALQELDLAATDAETMWKARALAGEALCQLRSFELAVQTLLPVVEQFPEDVDAHRWLAVAYFDMGTADQALVHLLRVSELAPRDSRPQQMMGLIYADAENYVPAAQAYQAALQRDLTESERESTLAALAKVQLKLRQYPEVLVTLADAPATPALNSLQADALYALGRSDEARRLVDEVLKTEPVPGALILRGLMLLDDQRPRDAIEPLRQAVKLHPDEFETRFKLSQALSLAGEKEAARREIDEVSRIKAIRLEFADLQKRALENPRDAELRFQMGRRCESLHRPELAQKWYRAALALNPDHAAALQALSRYSALPKKPQFGDPTPR